MDNGGKVMSEIEMLEVLVLVLVMGWNDELVGKLSVRERWKVKGER